MTGESYKPGQAEPPRTPIKRPGQTSLIVGWSVAVLLAVVTVVTGQLLGIVVVAAWTSGWTLWFMRRVKAASRPPAGSG
ncbi:MAG TPA: hypothetical protein VGF32_27985 [Streptosporangiaceae bacterium]|jgi:hypothetical protein